MTTISPVNLNINTKRGAKIGTTVGAGVATGYIAKNAKQLFKEIPEKAVESGVSKKIGYVASGAAAAIVSAGIVGAGSLIGAGIGKIVDMVKHKKQEKEVKELFAEVLTKDEKTLNEVKTIGVDELEKIADMSDEDAIKYFDSIMKQTTEE